jgi:cytochrome P450
MDANEILGGLLSPEGREDPNPWYAAAHELGSVLSLGDGMWLVHGYEANNQMLRADAYFGPWDDRFNRPFTNAEWKLEPAVASLTESILDTNPPKHTRMRDVLGRVFSARRIAALEPMIRQLTRERLDAMAEAGSDGSAIDFMDVFAYQLAIGVIGEFFGMPREDWPLFKRLGEAWTLVFEVAPTEEDTRIANEGWLEEREYFEKLVARRRNEPGDDFISAVVQIVDREDAPLTAEELICNLGVVLTAGFHAQAALFGNALSLLLQHPEVTAGLREKTITMDSVVEEILRFDPPATFTLRVAREEGAMIDGTPIPVGDWTINMLGAANRDPARYSDPDRFDPTRKNTQPISFSVGIHHCLGAPFSRLQLSVALDELLKRFPGIAPGGEPIRRDRVNLRSYEHLPVILG